MKITFFGLSITSSWGNGHATTFRALIRQLQQQGHQVTFFERNVRWYAGNRDLPNPEFCQTILYDSLSDLQPYYHQVFDSDAIIIGSFVPEGIELGTLLTAQFEVPVAFYDIDTPVTLKKLEAGDYEYLTPDLISRYDMYLSFSGGPVLDLLEGKYQSPRALPLYCSVDPEIYYPEETEKLWKLGYMGTYSDDRQPTVEQLLLNPAREMKDEKFIVAGPGYLETEKWPGNVSYIDHLPPARHRTFYNQQCFTLNVTRRDMINAGYSPSVRLFEAAACGTSVISDRWEGIDEIFEPGKEILIADSSVDINFYLSELSGLESRKIGAKAREKVLSKHTSAHRAAELVAYLEDLINKRSNEYSVPAKNQ